MALLRRRSQKIELLREVPLFVGLPNKDLDAIARHADEVTVEAGHVLAEEGEVGTAFYILVAGTATVRKKGRKLSELGPGDFLGEMSLLDGQRRSATVKMDTEGAVLEIHRREFTPLLLESPRMSLRILEGLSVRLRNADRSIVD